MSLIISDFPFIVDNADIEQYHEKICPIKYELLLLLKFISQTKNGTIN